MGAIMPLIGGSQSPFRRGDECKTVLYWKLVTDGSVSQSPFRRGDECKGERTVYGVLDAIKSQSPFRRGDECKVVH